MGLVGHRACVKLATVCGVFDACLPQSMSRTPVQAVQASPYPPQLLVRNPAPTQEVWVASAAVQSP